ncbi:hypothetical protein QYE76_008250 [Lolium multiflorum]|uniref:Uncharacterized protein n=1 Tax=Lolium multiflorum TaxID=4521 RepID=A0AAD8QI72_LOLMU|nr:hypothetical protein QYE76_008250 [Lolium multiflorum]
MTRQPSGGGSLVDYNRGPALPRGRWNSALVGVTTAGFKLCGRFLVGVLFEDLVPTFYLYNEGPRGGGREACPRSTAWPPLDGRPPPPALAAPTPPWLRVPSGSLEFSTAIDLRQSCLKFRKGATTSLRLGRRWTSSSSTTERVTEVNVSVADKSLILKALESLGILRINRVLQSLPPSYKNFVMNYNMQNMNKELHELFSMLKSAEVEIQKEHQVLMVNKTTGFKKQGKSKGKFKKGGKKAATPPVKPKNGP